MYFCFRTFFLNAWAHLAKILAVSARPSPSVVHLLAMCEHLNLVFWSSWSSLLIKSILFSNINPTLGEDEEEVEESLVARGVPILVAGRRQQECQHLLIGATCHGGEVGG